MFSRNSVIDDPGQLRQMGNPSVLSYKVLRLDYRFQYGCANLNEKTGGCSSDRVTCLY